MAISAATAELAAQTTINTLTCSGIGGLASAALGIMSAIKADPSLLDAVTSDGSPSLDAAVLRTLPQGPITLFNDGNNFEVVIRNSSVKVNGLDLVPFAVVTALHSKIMAPVLLVKGILTNTNFVVVFAGIAFLLLLPLYLSWGAAWRFSVIAGYPINEAKNLKWRMWFLTTFAIFSVVGIILGIVGIGNSSHFRDAHGVSFVGNFSYDFAKLTTENRLWVLPPSSSCFQQLASP